MTTDDDANAVLGDLGDDYWIEAEETRQAVWQDLVTAAAADGWDDVVEELAD